MSYDKHGNIQSITRKGILENSWASDGFTPQHRMGIIDQLSFGPYQGNQILNVSDASVEDQLFMGSQDFKDNQDGNNDYAYDANGNMVRDLNKNISTIRYNFLNLPDTVQMRNGHYTAYNRDATGGLIRIQHRTCTGSNVSIPLGGTVVTNPSGYSLTSTANTEFYDNFVYESERVRRFFIDDGIVMNMAQPTTPTATPDFEYHFYLKDHLGNIRVVFHKARGTGNPDSLLVVDQVNNYYPFGMEFGEDDFSATVTKTYQNHLFSGKEFDNKFQMNTYNFGARELSVDIPIWRSVDPMAEKRPWMSPYVYCSDNPLNRIDPDGRWDFELPMTKAYLKGLWNGASSTVQAAVHIVAHPVETGKKIATAVAHPSETGHKIANAATETYNSFVNGSAEQRAYMTGSLLGGLAIGEGAAKAVSGASKLAKGTTAAETAVTKTTTAAESGQTTVYRVFGGDSRADGFSWTPTNPTTVSDFRNLAGLPSGGASGFKNTAEFMIQGKVNASDIITIRPALPLDGNVGGLPEYLINPQNVSITNFKVLKP